jgi:hypothetical protein
MECTYSHEMSILGLNVRENFQNTLDLDHTDDNDHTDINGKVTQSSNRGVLDEINRYQKQVFRAKLWL